MPKRLELRRLLPRHYRHPEELAQFEVLQSMQVLRSLLARAEEIGLDGALRLRSLEGRLLISREQFPGILRVFEEACRILKFSGRIDLFLEGGRGVESFVEGNSYPHIVLTAGLVDALEDEELLFVFGHEIGHIKCGHLPYLQVLRHFSSLFVTSGHALLPGGLLEVSLRTALVYWAARAELTADRAGMLAVQDFSCVEGALLKLAGLPEKYQVDLSPDALKVQANEAELVAQVTAGMMPFDFPDVVKSGSGIVTRLVHLREWVGGGDYDRVLDECSGPESYEYPADVKVCPKCGAALPVSISSCVFCHFRFSD